jgi:hypothetical protein
LAVVVVERLNHPLVVVAAEAAGDNRVAARQGTPRSFLQFTRNKGVETALAGLRRAQPVFV